MAKGNDPASQYVFVEDEDIFAEDERRLAARNTSTTLVRVPSRNHVVPVKVSSKFHRDVAKLKKDHAKLHRANKLLTSVPPPPSTTNPQFSLNSILEIWHRNNHVLDGLKNNWKDGLSEEKLGHDVYLNCNDSVEELEHLRLSLQDRFMSNQTTSHLSSYISSHQTALDKQHQKHNGWLTSPASRVDYLSQRKLVFSSFSSNLKTFTVDNTKRTTFLKSNSESKVIKAHVPKRALFQSPEKQHPSNAAQRSNHSVSSLYGTMPPSNYSESSVASTASSSSSSSMVTPSWSLLNKWAGSRGEVRQVSSAPRCRDASVKRNCSKSLKFEESKEKSLKPKKLSQVHFNKLCWAVKTLLIREGVVSSDHEYKTLFANLYKETTHVWLKYYENEPREYLTGTSDLMVNVAKKLLPGIEQKLGIFCSVIKARKQAVKKITPTSSSPRAENLTSQIIYDPSTLNSSLYKCSSSGLEPSRDTSAQYEETAFSPEILGVSNLREDIDAVISSLDNLPTDPGNQRNVKLNSSLIPPKSVTSNVPVSNNASDNSVPSSSSHEISKVDDSVTKIVDINHDDISVTTLQCHTNTNLAVHLPTIPIDVPASGPLRDTDKNIAQNQTYCALLELTSSAKDPLAPLTDLPQYQAVEIISVNPNQSVHDTDQSVSNDTPAIIPLPTSLNQTMTNNELNQENSSDVTNSDESNGKAVSVKPCDILPAFVRLERCDYLLANSEDVNTPKQSFTTKLKIKYSQKVNAAIEPCQINGYSPKGNTIEQDDGGKTLTPSGSVPKSSDLKRSKRKRNSDASSCENTPSTSTKMERRSSKRLCYIQEAEPSETTAELEVIQSSSSSLRRSRRNKSFDKDKSSEIVEKENEVIDTHKLPDDFETREGNRNAESESNVEKLRINEASCSTNALCSMQRTPSAADDHQNDPERCKTDKVKAPDETCVAIALNHEGESSTTENKAHSDTPVDKENDSSMENISDVDTQNWSPILKLKRSSKNLWSSELRKKRISTRRRKDNVENSPISSPFLDLEGPFKYRFCKRALPGEFITTVIEDDDDIDLRYLQKFVRNWEITEDCILVRTVKKGIELRIPISLLRRENSLIGPNNNFVKNTVGDFLGKLEEQKSVSFCGFSVHEINRAVLTSCRMNQVLKILETTGEMVKPLFTMHNYAIVKRTPQNIQNFCQVCVEIFKTSLFLMRSHINMDTIQVKPMKSTSPKKLLLEINIPVNLVTNTCKLKESVLKDLNPVHNIISC